MSGHSKWAKVKYQKAAKDPKRGQAFSKITNLITVASRDGADINTNPKLRLAVEKAKELGMPKENIERAIERGSGTGAEAKQLEELMCEAYGPGGTAILIQAITDNKNRTLAELRHLLSSYDAKMANSGSVRYMFKETGRLTIPKNKWDEDLELKIIEQGAEDIKELPETIEIYTPINNLHSLSNFLSNLIPGINLDTAIEYVSQQPVPITDPAIKQKLESLFDALDEHNDVEEIYSNAEYQL
ncbi:MAG: YebC/PmpR family DNA-binding transcriptional regulator [Parcubacteria group bacterium]|nr:YebC/PmpR family DNA-binding transcriptional regulator [Parcubacteria group bacterium]